MKKTFLEWVKADKKAKWRQLIDDILSGKLKATWVKDPASF